MLIAGAVAKWYFDRYGREKDTVDRAIGEHTVAIMYGGSRRRGDTRYRLIMGSLE